MIYMIKKEYKYSDVTMVELKAISELDKSHIAQCLNYLEVYNLEIGLLINFGSQSLEFKRLTNEKKFKLRQQKKTGLH